MNRRRNVLVKCGDSQKPVVLDPPWNKQQLSAAIVERFSLLADVPVLLQIFDKDWDTYIDLEEDTVIPDRSRLLCIISPNIYTGIKTSARSSASVDHPPPTIVQPPRKDNNFLNNVLSGNIAISKTGSSKQSSMSETSVRLPYQQLTQSGVVTNCFGSLDTNERRHMDYPSQMFDNKPNFNILPKIVHCVEQENVQMVPAVPMGISFENESEDASKLNNVVTVTLQKEQKDGPNQPEVNIRKRKYCEQAPSSDQTGNDLVNPENSSLEMHVYSEADDSSNSRSFDQETDEMYLDPNDPLYQNSRLNREEILARFEKKFGNNPSSWPSPYQLPKQLFPPMLLNALENKSKLDSQKANLLIRCLSDDMQAHSIFPSVKQREEVVQSLVREYPHLRDLSPCGWGYHYQKLSERFKNIRRKMSRGGKAPPYPSPGPPPSPNKFPDVLNIKLEKP